MNTEKGLKVCFFGLSSSLEEAQRTAKEGHKLKDEFIRPMWLHKDEQKKATK